MKGYIRGLVWGLALFVAQAMLVTPSKAVAAQDAQALTQQYVAAKKTVRAAPKKAAGWVDLGLAANALGKSKEAKACFIRALNLDQDNLRARLELMNLLASAGDSAGAARQAEKLRAKSGLSGNDEELAETLAAMTGDQKGLSLAGAQKAAELLSAGKADEAARLLSAAGETNDPATLYLLGLTAARQGKAKSAAELFRRVLEQEPGNARVRLELAAALYADKQFGESQAELLKLKERTLPQDVGQTLDRFLEATQAAQAKPWRVRGSVSYLFDSNATQGPFASGVTTTIGRVSLPKLAQAQADSAMVYALDGDYTFLFTDTFGWQFQASAKATDYFHLNQYDTLQLAAATGPTASLGRFTLSAPFTFNYLKYDFNTTGYYYMAAGVAPQVRYRLTDQIYASLNLGYQHKFYDPSYDRRSDVLSASPSVRYFIDDRSFVEAGGVFLFEKQNFDIYSYASYGGFASYFRTILPNLTAGAALQVSWLDYLQERKIFEKTQHDFNITTRVSVGYTIESLWKLTPELSYTYTHNGSTIPLYAYDRHQIMAGISRTF